MTKSKVMSEFQAACLKKIGCPFCSIADRIAFQTLQAYIGQENETPAPIMRLGPEERFCCKHASQLKYHLWSSDRSSLAIAEAYEQLIGDVERRLMDALGDGGRAAASYPVWFSRRDTVTGAVGRLAPSLDACPVCRTVQALEVSTIWTVAERLLTDQDESLDWISASFGLCLPHFCGLVHEVQDETISRRLCEIELSVFSDLRERLLDYIEKHGYCFAQDEFSAWEEACWSDAIDLTVGVTA